MYSDVGLDRRLTYNSVKLVFISLFIELDLDLLIALRTAPNNSSANPVERIMSIVNIGLQGVGVMRAKVGDLFEKAVGLYKHYFLSVNYDTFKHNFVNQQIRATL